MATADDYFAQSQLTDEDRRAAAIRALMMASAAAFATNDGRPMGSVLGATMFSGLRGYDDSLGAAHHGRMDQLATRKQAMELAQADKRIADQQALGDAMREAASGGAAPGGAPVGGQGPSYAAEAGAAMPAQKRDPREQQRRMLQATIDNLVAKGAGHMVGPLQEQLAKLEPEINTIKVGVDPATGQRVQIKVFKDGTEQVSPFAPDREKLHFTDNGQQTGIGIDPFSGEVKTAGVQRTMTPGEVDSSARGRESLNLQRDQFNRGRVQYDADRGGTVNLDTGVLNPVTQGGQPVPPKMAEKQKGELLALDKQMAQVQGALEAVKSVPDAFGAKRGAATMAGSIPETIAGRFDSPPQREARAYVFNVVSAVINERAGAAQSKQELARLRSFLPGEMDSSEQIQNKLEGFQKYLGDSRTAVSQPITAAGPKAVEAKATGPKPGDVEDGYVFLGGNAGDKRNWKRQ
jgi:hypothetical protein